MSDKRSSHPEQPGVSRRSFLHMVGAAGGAAAVYETMVALGMVREPLAWAGPLKLAAGSGNGRSVVILGAGVGGVAAARELRASRAPPVLVVNIR